MPFAPSSMQITSHNFSAFANIPQQYTGEGDDISPALHWHDAPSETQSFAVICHDPDAPKVDANGVYGYTHWVLYNIPGDVSSLPEGCVDYTAGINDGGNLGYNGPMPPEGHGKHHYYFWIIALDTVTDLPEGLSQQALLTKIEPNILGMNRLIGSYQRG